MPNDVVTLHDAGSFQARLLEIVKQDYKNAKTHLHDFHRKCNEVHEMYHNAKKYTDLKTQSQFPIPFLQQTVDQFKGDLQDKLHYANRPCQLVGREDTDKADAEAKQQMMEYQDEVLGMYTKMGLWVQSCAMYRIAVGQVDWWEDTQSDWTEEDVPQMELDQSGIPRPRLDMSGQPIMSGQKRWVKKDYTNFMGAKPKYIRVTDFFFTEDKETMQDEFPIMIRGDKSRRFFDRPYFINVDKLADIKTEGSASEEKSDAASRKKLLHYETKSSPPGRPYEYVEWQGPLNKAEIYAELAQLRPKEYQEITPGQLYLELAFNEKGEEIDRKLIEIESEDETCWAIVGMTNEQVINRLEPNPFGLYCPNVVVGYMLSEDEGLTGALSLSELIEAVHKGLQVNMGMWIENLKQSVDAGAIINTDGLINPEKVEVNTAGFTLLTNKDVNQVYKRVEQPRVSPDILVLQNFLEQAGRRAIGRDEIITGQGDPATETLGESNIVFQQALLRTRDYLKSFEDSFIIPLWRMRAAVNAEFITQDYAIRVLGAKGYEWKKIKASQVKASVDFICESSKREHQKAVLAQQIIEVAKLAPLAIQAGQPVRIDVLIEELGSSCFNWLEEKINRVLPGIAYEKSMEDPNAYNKMLAENAMLQHAMIRLNMIAAAGNALVGAPSMGGNGQPRKGGTAGASAKPKTDAEVEANANARFQPDLRKT